MHALAQLNFETLSQNAYPGRGIVIGMDLAQRCFVQIYWIMGRSANSRNRIFEAEKNGLLKTKPADLAKVQDPSLIIYHAMRELKGRYVVTNGDQTDTIIQGFLAGTTFMQALNTRTYEPDAPNFTARISAICSIYEGMPIAELAILKKSPLGEGCDRLYFRYEQFSAGYGIGLTTYMTNADPLPSFHGEPMLLPIQGETPASVAKIYWDILNEDNRISLAVKFIDLASGNSEISIINKY